MEVDEFLAAISASAQSPRSATPSSAPTAARSVRSRRWSPQTGTPATCGSPDGVILEKETFIPLDAATHRADGRVYINLPKLVVGKMPWTEPPSTEDLPKKYGTPRADVTRLYHGHEPTGLRS
jgi:ureidoacrylate peracid hydrolase